MGVGAGRRLVSDESLRLHHREGTVLETGGYQSTRCWITNPGEGLERQQVLQLASVLKRLFLKDMGGMKRSI